MFPMTLSFTVADEKQLALFQTLLGVKPEIRAVTATVEPKPAKPEAPKADPKPEPAASVAPPAATPATPAPTAAASGGKTVDDAKSLTMKIVADKGRDAAVDLLKKYGVPVAAKLAADQVAAFCADAEAVLAS